MFLFKKGNINNKNICVYYNNIIIIIIKRRRKNKKREKDAYDKGKKRKNGVVVKGKFEEIKEKEGIYINFFFFDVIINSLLLYT